MAKKEQKGGLSPTRAVQTIQWSKIGGWVFLIGILVAIIGVFIAIPGLVIILIIAGLIVGLVNITAGEVHEFLTAAITLLLVGTAGIGAVELLGEIVGSVLKNTVIFVSPAALVVALKSIWALAKSY